MNIQYQHGILFLHLTSALKRSVNIYEKNR